MKVKSTLNQSSCWMKKLYLYNHIFFCRNPFISEIFLRRSDQYVPSFFTCLKCLHFFTCLTCPHLFFVLSVPSFFTCFTCLHCFTCLTCLTCLLMFTHLTCLHVLRALRTFTFLSTSDFWRDLSAFTFFIKCGTTHNQPEPAGISKNEVE